MTGPGEWTDPWYSPAVAAGDIRRWAIATFWPQRPPALFVDPDYAATTRWRGLIAPRDFNPFAWPVEPPPAVVGADREYFPDHPQVMNGGQADRYGEPIRPGDVIAARMRLRHVVIRPTRLGDTRFVSVDHEWVNQHGDFVRWRTATLIRYPA